MEVIRKFLHELARQRNPSLTIECYMLVTGVAYSGDSMTDIARRHGLTRAAVSKRCIELADMLGIHASRAMKSEDARKAYSTARKKSLQKSKI
jgi:transposase-like protein